MIDDRSDELINIVNKQLAQKPAEDSSVDVAFNTHDFQRLLVLLETFGSVHTSSLDKEILGDDVVGTDATTDNKSNFKEEVFDESVFLKLKGITFCIKTGIRYTYNHPIAHSLANFLFVMQYV